MIDFDKILSDLDVQYSRKKEIETVKLKEQFDRIEKERCAYYDGAYDAIKTIKILLEKEAKKTQKQEE